MASKRKSTTPCMIPSKVIHLSDDAEQDCPLLARQSRISGGSRHSPLEPGESSKHEAGDPVKDNTGTYTCKPCNFETPDLNLFLDHVYAGHSDFRADPGFLCVNCGFSAPKFEGLALHNARIHPSLFNTNLQLRKRDRRLVVEQNLAIGTETSKENEIAITKTPIMRMLKGKSEPKRIVVSHPVSDESCSDPTSVSTSKESERRETTTGTVTHVPTIVHNGTTKVTLPSAIQIVNGSGALPMLKTPITQVVSVVQNRSLHQSVPITSSSDASSSSSSSKNLPKVMIPLSSIPTYSASMDSSSFLKTSFSKFPYPTKAELCYLTVVTKFPEEQIKIWFTAQRLKQGISWSPEEIEEARRKMFNTIIQTASTSSQSQTQSHPSPAQHTITVLPASLGTTGIPHILQGSLVSQGGVIVTQPVVANGIQVSSAPVALAVTPKPQAAARPMMQARPAAALVADKGISMTVGAVGSSSTGSTIISSSKSSKSSSAGTSAVVTSSQASVINLSGGSSNHVNNAQANSVNGKHGGVSAASSESSHTNVSSPLNTAKGNGDSKKTEICKATNTSVTLSDEIDADGREMADDDCPEDGFETGHDEEKIQDADGERDKSNTTTASTEDVDSNTCDSPSAKTEEASSPASKCSSPSPAAASSGTSGSRSINSFLDQTFCKGKKSQQQLSALKGSFLNSQFPNQEEVERLISLTGLTVREVRKWFSDRRYHYRNLKSSRSGTGGHMKAGAGGVSPPGSGGTSGADLSESGGNSSAKAHQHGAAPLSPTASHTPTSPTTPSRRAPRPPSPDFTAIRYKEREPHQVKALEASFAQEPEPPGEEVDRLRFETKMTRREIHGWFSERRKKLAAEKKREEAERARREEEEMDLDAEERQKEDGSGELKVNPIKINLKMLKVTEANGKAEGEESDCPVTPIHISCTLASSPVPAPSSTPKLPQSSAPKATHSPKTTTLRGKKTAEQLHLLKLAYVRTRWPNATQYDELISATGLPRPEVVRWFGDCRYMQKNSQLKWLEAYQNLALEDSPQKDNHLRVHSSRENTQIPLGPQLKESVQVSTLTTNLVQQWFSSKSSSPLAKAAGEAHKLGPKPAPNLVAKPAPTPPTGPAPVELQPGGKDGRVLLSACGVRKEAEEAGAGKTVNPTEGTD